MSTWQKCIRKWRKSWSNCVVIWKFWPPRAATYARIPTTYARIPPVFGRYYKREHPRNNKAMEDGKDIILTEDGKAQIEKLLKGFYAAKNHASKRQKHEARFSRVTFREHEKFNDGIQVEMYDNDPQGWGGDRRIRAQNGTRAAWTRVIEVAGFANRMWAYLLFAGAQRHCAAAAQRKGGGALCNAMREERVQGHRLPQLLRQFGSQERKGINGGSRALVWSPQGQPAVEGMACAESPSTPGRGRDSSGARASPPSWS